ncbi:hypothetical protein [Streptomyces sp. URMC 129]|uniref:hypothetical protein n=1 Tax=Streptomyces sp. URMC 129 TaxID=3423407 RepID=UPI003F1BA045
MTEVLPVAFRAEFIAYSWSPEPRMLHLGDAFSTEVSAVQEWVRSRGIAATDSLTDDDAVARKAMDGWSREVASEETSFRLAAGEVFIYSFSSSSLVWELSLRPVPTVLVATGTLGPGGSS